MQALVFVQSLVVNLLWSIFFCSIFSFGLYFSNFLLNLHRAFVAWLRIVLLSMLAVKQLEKKFDQILCAMNLNRVCMLS
jgi:hypothetical protein